jgi:hypothetical protein
MNGLILSTGGVGIGVDGPVTGSGCGRVGW